MLFPNKVLPLFIDISICLNIELSTVINTNCKLETSEPEANKEHCP